MNIARQMIRHLQETCQFCTDPEVGVACQCLFADVRTDMLALGAATSFVHCGRLACHERAEAACEAWVADTCTRAAAEETKLLRGIELTELGRGARFFKLHYIRRRYFGPMAGAASFRSWVTAQVGLARTFDLLDVDCHVCGEPLAPHRYIVNDDPSSVGFAPDVPELISTHLPHDQAQEFLANSTRDAFLRPATEGRVRYRETGWPPCFECLFDGERVAVVRPHDRFRVVIAHPSLCVHGLRGLGAKYGFECPAPAQMLQEEEDYLAQREYLWTCGRACAGVAQECSDGRIDHYQLLEA